MKNQMILIAGRTGSGKNTYADILKEKGYKEVISYTTRPKRYETEDTHIFISNEEADIIEDKVASTTINDYKYFATKKQIQDADYYIIDPIGIAELTENCPDTEFLIIYIDADKETRYNRALSRGNSEKEADIFNKRDASEDKEFTEFEEIMNRYDNIIVHDNNKNGTDLRKMVESDLLIYNN